VKRALAREQPKFEDATKFRDACAIMDWCSEKLSPGGFACTISPLCLPVTPRVPSL